jgi:TM2 domain
MSAMAAARSPWLHHHFPKGMNMTTPNPEQTPAPHEGNEQQPAPTYPSDANPPQYPAQEFPDQAPQYQGQPDAPPYQAQQPQYPAQYQQAQQPQYPGQPGVPQQPQYPAQYQQPQYPGQPGMPNQAYGYAEPKSKIAAGLLGIFLGGLGIHRFYLGYTTIGVIQLVLSIVTFGIASLWGFVEGILILVGTESFRRDARGIPLRD